MSLRFPASQTAQSPGWLDNLPEYPQLSKRKDSEPTGNEFSKQNPKRRQCLLFPKESQVVSSLCSVDSWKWLLDAPAWRLTVALPAVQHPHSCPRSVLEFVHSFGIDGALTKMEHLPEEKWKSRLGDSGLTLETASVLAEVARERFPFPRRCDLHSESEEEVSEAEEPSVGTNHSHPPCSCSRMLRTLMAGGRKEARGGSKPGTYSAA